MKIGNKLEDYVRSKEPVTRSALLMQESAKRLKIPHDAIQEIIKPSAVRIERLNVQILGVVVNIVSGIVLHDRARGPYKGGIRLAHDVDLWETTELARLMTLKTALADIELGGGKSGISVDLRALYTHMTKTQRFSGNYRDFERIAKADIMSEFARTFGGLFASHKYIPAPDMGTGGAEMVRIYNQTQDPASVTGKPDGIEGWLPGRAESTGYGVFYGILKDMEHHGLAPDQCSVALQGYGKVGSYAARFLFHEGVRVIGVTDISGGVHDPIGLDIDALDAHCAATGAVSGFTKTNLTNEALFKLKCNYLVPAASGHVIDEKNAKTIGAKCVVEAANMPISYEGMKVLESRGISILPDTYANAGGVIASNLEYRQALGGLKFTREQTLAEIRARFDGTLAAAEPLVRKGRTLTEATTDIALRRVYETMLNRSMI
ncbi:MAG TPA: Glu/Leu/Phe/Val dehydrogenase [Candidatus Hydrogenedentes bacterium]|nr:Glu/Leu/Phe/Val dehydrogenase [Candidatus Hydrogenedentota bacterium]